ncbi:MAG: rhodanese-like domain-containing protein [Anaerolineae bacterium]|nr:rhodanese [Anaerolineae bacterium]
MLKQTELPQISVEELKRLRDDETPHVLLDVREEHEWKLARIEGAQLLPLSRLARELTAAFPADLTPDSHVIVQCHHGVRSVQVTAWLRQLGFNNVFNLAGGIDDWSLRIDPRVPRY